MKGDGPEDSNSLKQITIREATVDDVCFIADCVLASVDAYIFGGKRPEEYESIRVVCTLDDTLYSYRNALIADFHGEAVGCLVAYPGDNYEQARERTAETICSVKGGIDFGDSALETGPGEFYLDSMAVVPSFRGNGLGHLLLKAQIQRGRNLGYNRFSLIVAKSHSKLKEYYEQLGFRQEGELTFLGEEYFKCVITE